MLEELLRFGGVAGQSFGFGEGQLEVRLAGDGLLAMRIEGGQRGLRIALLHHEIGAENGNALDEDAVGIFLVVVVQDGLGLGQLIALQEGLGGEVVGVVGERAVGLGVAGSVGQMRGVERADGIRKVALEQIGVAEGEVRGGGGFSGVAVRVGADPGIGGGSGRLGQLLGHGPQLRRGDESMLQATAAGQLARRERTATVTTMRDGAGAALEVVCGGAVRGMRVAGCGVVRCRAVGGAALMGRRSRGWRGLGAD